MKVRCGHKSSERHKKQAKAMFWTFINFSQVETETAHTPQLNTFGFKRAHCDIIRQKLSVFLTQNFSLDVEPMADNAGIYEFV